jgi:hypothetical protein
MPSYSGQVDRNNWELGEGLSNFISFKPYKCSNHYAFLKSELKKACLRKRKKGKKSQPKKIGKKRTGKYTETMFFYIFPCLICSAKIDRSVQFTLGAEMLALACFFSVCSEVDDFQMLVPTPFQTV